MKLIHSRPLRATVVIAAAGAMALAACGSGGTASNGPAATHILSTTIGQYGTLPPATGTPHKGGTFTYGIVNGSQPNFIFPIAPEANGSIYNSQFVGEMDYSLEGGEISDRPLLDFANGLTNAPVYSNSDKTVTLNLKSTITWSNGAAVDAADVEFYIDILKAALKESPDNFGDYTPGDFPDNIASMSSPSKFELVLNIKKAYNPNWFNETQLNVIIPMPSTYWDIDKTNGPAVDYTKPANAKKIYDYLIAQAKDIKTYATNPLWQDVDGPYHLTAFNTTTDANTLTPNPKYTGVGGVAYATAKATYFASSTAETDALRSGTLNLGGVPSTDLPQVPALKRKGYNVWGYPDLGFNYLVFNFKDTTDSWSKIIGQLYIRQALAKLQDEPAVIKGVYKGAAAEAFGPVPSIPQTAYVPANATLAATPYKYDVTGAGQLLTSHGWKIVNGVSTCESPGSAATDCGAGIPKGAQLKITVPYTSDPPTIQQQLAGLATDGKKIGVIITPVGKTFNYLISNYDDGAAASNDDKWQAEDFGGFTEDIYPTTDEIFNTTGSFNIGGYSDPMTDKLIKDSEFSSNPDAVKNEATYITQQLPGIFEPNPDLISAWKGISGTPDSFASTSQYGLPLQDWYVTSSTS